MQIINAITTDTNTLLLISLILIQMQIIDITNSDTNTNY